ncbi:MAG TPA: hypothetical protein VHF44_01265, partial [Nitrososphaeraceae archaeon]|nr:hypothetical protein [Nitrososphaeraceae archaeon]
DSGLCNLVRIEDLNVIGPPVVGASRMVAEAEPFEALFNVSLGTWLDKDKERLSRDYGIHIKKNVLKQQNMGRKDRKHILCDFRNSQSIWSMLDKLRIYEFCKISAGYFSFKNIKIRKK